MILKKGGGGVGDMREILFESQKGVWVGGGGYGRCAAGRSVLLYTEVSIL